MTTKKTAYRTGVAVAVAGVLILMWLAAGVGVLGPDGDRANMMYLAVLVIGTLGPLTARFQPQGMALTLTAMAVAQAVITLIALVVGVQDSGVSPMAEIVALNGFFIATFLASAWLFRYSAQERASSDAAVGAN